MERHQGGKRRGYEKKYAQSSILPDKKFSKTEGRDKQLASSTLQTRYGEEVSPRSCLHSDDNNSPHLALGISYSFERTPSTSDVHPRTERGLLESQNDNIHFSRAGNKGLTSSCGDIRLIKDEIFPRSAVKSEDNVFPHSAFRPSMAFSYSLEDIPSIQDVHPRTGHGLYRSRNDNIHSSKARSKGLISSCGDIRLIEDEISSRNPLKSDGNFFSHSGFSPVVFSYSLEDIPSTQDIRLRTGRWNENIHSSRVGSKWLTSSCGDIRLIEDDIHPRTGHGLYRPRKDNIHSSRVGTKGLTSSCVDIRLTEDEISPRRAVKSEDNVFPHSAFRPSMAFSYSLEDIPSIQDVYPRTGSELYRSQNDNIHPLKIGSKGLSSSCGDLRLIKDEISPRSPLNSEDNNSLHSAFRPKAFSHSFEEIPSAQDSGSKIKEHESFANFICSHIGSNAKTQHLVTLKEEGDCFILRFNVDLHKVNSLYWDFKHINDGMLKKMFKKSLKRKSEKKSDKFERLLAQFQREGLLEVTSSEAKHNNNINLEYKVKNGLLWNLFSTKLSAPKNLPQKRENGQDALSNESDTEGKTQLWKWKQSSKSHKEKFIQLRKYGRDHPKDVTEISGVRVCFQEQFCIGKGRDGTRVYLGLGKDGIEKAVKRMRRDACISSAQDEMQALTKVKSSNVINYWMLLDEENDKEYLYLILELCEETLKNFVSRESPSHLFAIAPEIIRQILKGLVDLHRDPKPVLHRDIKPSNILKTVDDKWLLADFGISRIMENDASACLTNPKGTKDWMAVEACQCNGKAGDGKVRCTKESDIQVAGMVAFYIVTKGGHPYGEERYRLDNLLKGNPVDLRKVEDLSTNDFITWMLSHDPKERPSAEQALKHPYLQSEEQKFELLCKMGNENEIKKGVATSDVVRELNSDPTDWRNVIKPRILKYFSNGEKFHYTSSWTDCLRLIRNVKVHWGDRPKSRPKELRRAGDPRTYFLKLFPNLPVKVHKIVRQTDWRERPDLKNYFM